MTVVELIRLYLGYVGNLTEKVHGLCQFNGLTHCGPLTPYGTQIPVNIGSGNGLLPDGTKPLPEPTLTYYQNVFYGIPFRLISQEVLVNLICKLYLAITLLKLLPHLPRTNELIDTRRR